MKKLLLNTGSLFIVLNLFACSGEPGQEMEAQTSFDKKEMLTRLASDIDPFCGMELVIDLDNEEYAFADTTSYKGHIYGFCSASCKENFLTDPETYLAQLPDADTEYDEGQEDPQ